MMVDGKPAGVQLPCIGRAGRRRDRARDPRRHRLERDKAATLETGAVVQVPFRERRRPPEDRPPREALHKPSVVGLGQAKRFLEAVGAPEIGSGALGWVERGVGAPARSRSSSAAAAAGNGGRRGVGLASWLRTGGVGDRHQLQVVRLRSEREVRQRRVAGVRNGRIRPAVGDVRASSALRSCSVAVGSERCSGLRMGEHVVQVGLLRRLLIAVGEDVDVAWEGGLGAARFPRTSTRRCAASLLRGSLAEGSPRSSCGSARSVK